MINGMFQQGTDQALDDQLQRPKLGPPPAPPSFWSGFSTAIPRNIGAAVTEMGAFGAEVAGAFGDVAGAYPEAFSYSLTDTQKKQGEDARRKLLTVGPSYSTPAGDQLRATAKSIMPDPATTGAAGQVVGGMAGFVTKAIGYSLTMGPMGPLMLGGDVALTESDRLKQQGVDVGTRSAAGAVAGVTAAVSVVAPMSGATAAIRAAQGVAVGEGSIVGQSVAEKAILKAGGYDKLAETFDPLDPVALGVGLVPGAFGAAFGHAKPPPRASGMPTPLTDMTLGQRQALKYNDVSLDAYAVQAAQKQGIPPEVLLAVKNAGEKSGSTAVSPAGAKGVMQFLDSTFKQFGRGDATDPMNSIDAGAAYLKQLHAQYGDWDAAIAHYNGGGKQARAVLEGGAPTIPETAAYLKRVKGYLGDTLDQHAAAAVRVDPDLIDAARVLQASDAIDSSRLSAATDLAGRDEHATAIETAGDQIAAGERVTIDDLLKRPTLPDERPTQLAQALDAVRAASDPVASTARPAPEPMRSPIRDTLDAATRTLGERDPAQVLAEMRTRGEVTPAQNNAILAAAEARGKPGKLAEIADHHDQLAQKAPKGTPPEDILHDAVLASRKERPAQASIDMAAAAVHNLNPDLLVHMDGMEAPMRVGDLLERVKAEAADDASHAQLVQIAAECALRN